VVTWSADQAGSDHQQPVADGVAGRLLARDFGFAVQVAVSVVAIGRREHLCAATNTAPAATGPLRPRARQVT
jgi:hypothetical protein